MSDLRARLIEFFSEESVFFPHEGPEEWADELLERVIDPEPVGTLDVTIVNGERYMFNELLPAAHQMARGTYTLYRLREIEP